MKKYLASLILPLAFCSIAGAAITDPQVLQEKTVVVHFSTTIPVNSSPVVIDLISLATATGVFPHGDTGEIHISQMNIAIDKLAASTGSVKIGVIDFISQSSGSVTFFGMTSFIKNVSNTVPAITTNYAPAFYRCRVNPQPTNTFDNGKTPYIFSNDTKKNSGVYTSTASLWSPISAGSVNPRTGDIVLEAVNSDATNTYIITGDIFYHSEPR